MMLNMKEYLLVNTGEIKLRFDINTNHSKPYSFAIYKNTLTWSNVIAFRLFLRSNSDKVNQNALRSSQKLL